MLFIQMPAISTEIKNKIIVVMQAVMSLYSFSLEL